MQLPFFFPGIGVLTKLFCSYFSHVFFFLGKACWKRYGSGVVYAAQVMQLSCACVLYLLLVADFFNDLFEHHSLSYSVWTVIAGCILLPSVFLNQLKRISWLSMFSVVALVMVYVAVIGFGVVNRYNWNFNLGLTTLEGFPVAWGIILFSFVCHPYLPGNMIIHEYYKGVLRDRSLFIACGVCVCGGGGGGKFEAEQGEI